jgi:hypothetical protein
VVVAQHYYYLYTKALYNLHYVMQPIMFPLRIPKLSHSSLLSIQEDSVRTEYRVRRWPISLTHGQACTAPKHLITVEPVEPFRVVKIAVI